jgi:agmatinase
VKERGIDPVLDEVMQNMKCDRLYLSLDMDVIDPGFAPGVGNPEPFGLSPWDVRRVIERVGPAAVGMDINEITPAYDHGETALLGARLIREFIASKGRYLKKML